MSRGSTLRTWLDPHGDLSRECVVVGNIMVGRWANRFETTSFYVVEFNKKKSSDTQKLQSLFFRLKMGIQLNYFRTLLCSCL